MTARLTSTGPLVESDQPDQEVWRALSSPVRRRLLDLLSAGPRTTGDLVDQLTELSRFAVMQHLGVLTDAGLVLVRRRGRFRFNHLNPVPLREWYQRRVSPLGDLAANEVVALRRHVDDERGAGEMAIGTDEVRVVRIETELRFRATPDRVFKALTEESVEWFPHTYGEDRVKAVVVEPRVGGRHYEDWGDGSGYLYGQVTVYDPPLRFATRGMVMAGSILDSDYVMETDGSETILRASKVAVGPMSDEEARSISVFGDLAAFEEPLRRVVESG